MLYTFSTKLESPTFFLRMWTHLHVFYKNRITCTLLNCENVVTVGRGKYVITLPSSQQTVSQTYLHMNTRSAIDIQNYHVECLVHAQHTMSPSSSAHFTANTKQRVKDAQGARIKRQALAPAFAWSISSTLLRQCAMRIYSTFTSRYTRR